MLRNTIALVLLTACSSSVLAQDTPGIDRMQANQRARIVQGVSSGQLTGPETRWLVHQERQLDRHETRVEADGNVTRAERYRLERNALRTSRAIHTQRHDLQTRH